MGNILIVSASEKDSAAIVHLLKDAFDHSSISMIKSGREAVNKAAYYEYDLVVVNCPLIDGAEYELAGFLSSSTTAGCVMIVSNENADSYKDKMEPLGIMVISKPVSKDVFVRSVRFIASLRERFVKLKTEDVRINKKPEEVRTINRAKSALIKYLKFSEQQAHRYIEKQAMDTRTTKLEVALKIIKMYDSQSSQNID